jgi:hypothetical protein
MNASYVASALTKDAIGGRNSQNECSMFSFGADKGRDVWISPS